MPADRDRSAALRPPRVSVVIPCYNAEAHLAETVASVLAQSIADHELIVVDDGSTDRSAALVGRLAAEHPERAIRLLRLPHSGHPAYPRNAGVEAAAAEIVLCLDADDLLTPNFLECCLRALDANPQAGFAYTDQQDFGDSERRHTVPEYDFHALTRKNFLGAAAVFRRQAWRDAGGFDPAIAYEDWDLWIGCGARGHHGIKVHGTEFRYRVRDDGRFQTDGIPKDRRTKAQLVLKRPELYTPEQHTWAQAVLSGSPAVDRIADQLWAIPELQAPAAGPVVAGTFSVAPGSGPRASVVIPAFNRAEYLALAIDSALSQHDVGGPIEVIVVDDGSTDETPAVLARYGDRIRAVRQDNAGLVAAVDRALGMVRGDYVALLDSDDTWPADRLVRHIGALEANPALGLVHGDLEIVDADGGVIHPSFLAREQITVHDGRVLGPLLAGNFVTGGASTFRGSLLPALHPIDRAAAYPDWWIAACVAAIAEIARVGGIASQYRQHGANMGLGSGSCEQPRIQRLELAWRRWMLCHLVGDDSITVRDLYPALQSLRAGLLLAASGEPAGARALLDRDRDTAAAALSTLPLPGAGGARSRALLRALAADPFDGAVEIDLELMLEREFQLRTPDPSPPLIGLQARSRLSLAWLGELAATPELLRAWGAEWAGSDRTLAILAPAGARVDWLVQAVAADPLLSAEDCDLTIIPEPATTPARRLLASRADARLSLAGAAAGYEAVPPDPAVERVDRAVAA